MTFKEKAKKIAYDNRFCIVFWIIFLVVFCFLYFGITFLDNEVTAKHITTEVGIVSDKFFGNGDNSDYYLVTLNNGKTYYILDKQDGEAKKLYDKITIGKKYRLILRENAVEDEDNFTHVIEVQELEK